MSSTQVNEKASNPLIGFVQRAEELAKSLNGYAARGLLAVAQRGVTGLHMFQALANCRTEAIGKENKANYNVIPWLLKHNIRLSNLMNDVRVLRFLVHAEAIPFPREFNPVPKTVSGESKSKKPGAAKRKVYMGPLPNPEDITISDEVEIILSDKVKLSGDEYVIPTVPASQLSVGDAMRLARLWESDHHPKSKPDTEAEWRKAVADTITRHYRAIRSAAIGLYNLRFGSLNKAEGESAERFAKRQATHKLELEAWKQCEVTPDFEAWLQDLVEKFGTDLDSPTWQWFKTEEPKPVAVKNGKAKKTKAA